MGSSEYYGREHFKKEVRHGAIAGLILFCICLLSS